MSTGVKRLKFLGSGIIIITIRTQLIKTTLIYYNFDGTKSKFPPISERIN